MRKLLVIGLMVIGYLGCKKSDEQNQNNGEEPDFTGTAQFAKPAGADATYIGKLYRFNIGDTISNFFGTYKADGTPGVIRATSIERLNDSVRTVYMYNEKGQVEFQQIYINNVLSPLLTRFEYASPTEIVHRIYEANWVTNTFRTIFEKEIFVAPNGTLSAGLTSIPYTENSTDPYGTLQRWNTLAANNVTVNYANLNTAQQATLLLDSNKKLFNFLGASAINPNYYQRIQGGDKVLLAAAALAMALVIYRIILKYIGPNGTVPIFESIPGYSAEVDLLNPFKGHPQYAAIVKDIITSKTWNGYSYIDIDGGGCDEFKALCNYTYSSSCGTEKEYHKYLSIKISFNPNGSAATDDTYQIRKVTHINGCVLDDSGLLTKSESDNIPWAFNAKTNTIELIDGPGSISYWKIIALNSKGFKIYDVDEGMLGLK